MCREQEPSGRAEPVVCQYSAEQLCGSAVVVEQPTQPLVAFDAACVFSIFVRVDIAQLFRLPLQLVPWMTHPIDSQIQTRSAPRDHAPSGSQCGPWSSSRFRSFAAPAHDSANREEQAIVELALRQQLAVYAQDRSRPRLSPLDRTFWVALSRLWPQWRNHLVVVRPRDRSPLASPGIPALLAFDLYARPWPPPYL